MSRRSQMTRRRFLESAAAGTAVLGTAGSAAAPVPPPARDRRAGLTQMPPYPTDPRDYIDKWDPFVLRSAGGERPPLAVSAASAKVTLNVDILPAHGRQIARDGSGNWLVLVEQERRSLLVGSGPRSLTAGGDLAFVEIVGGGSGALFPSPEGVAGAGMVVDARDRLHVVWCGSGGLWYLTAGLREAASGGLGDRRAWAEPRRLVEGACHPGDIMLDAAGEAVVCYARDDAVYYLPIASGRAERAAGPGSGLPPLPGGPAGQETAPPVDDATPRSRNPRSGRRPTHPPPLPLAERECQEAVMDLAADGTVHLAFRRDFEIWVTRRGRDGTWLAAECAARGQAFHPSIVADGPRPLVCFQYEAIKRVALGGADYLRAREGGGSSVAFAARTPEGWTTGALASSEEIVVNRQGTWDKRYQGRVLPMMEQMGWPVLFRDRHGVAWALWQNTTRRWSYCARWLGEGFGQVQECRGPFNAPALPVVAEKHMPSTATDVGVLFFAAGRAIFDRLKIPTLAATEERQVLFLDGLEVAETAGVELVLNPMTKHAANPVLSPGPPGSRDDRHVQGGRFSKHGPMYVLRYGFQSWDEQPKEPDGAEFKRGGLAISRDGVRWEKVAKLPADFPPPDRRPDADDPIVRGYFDNPDTSDPARRFIRTVKSGEIGWAKGSYQLQYSADGIRWTDGPDTSIVNALREGARPNLWDTLDVPERRIKVYGRVYTSNARSCGVMWSSDLLHWHGAEHFLDPDDPYGIPPALTPVGPMRAQVFLDACAGKGEDQIYIGNVHIVEGLYLCDYVPCTAEHKMEFALAVSRDGLNFTRVKNGERTLAVGPPGSWDSGYVFHAWPERDGDVLRAYYTATTCHHGTDDLAYPAIQLGLATIRVNGWTYWTPKRDGRGGAVTTIPIRGAGARRGLAVNLEGAAGRTGAFAVEVLEARTGKPIRGFAAAECVPPKADGLEAPVAWRGGAALPGGDFRLRFHLRGQGVRLYCFGFRNL